jgi:hypothetical protein
MIHFVIDIYEFSMNEVFSIIVFFFFFFWADCIQKKGLKGGKDQVEMKETYLLILEWNGVTHHNAAETPMPVTKLLVFIDFF